jgi:hypothetical protein
VNASVIAAAQLIIAVAEGVGAAAGLNIGLPKKIFRINLSTAYMNK